jgi:hypothetical protein
LKTSTSISPRNSELETKTLTDTHTTKPTEDRNVFEIITSVANKPDIHVAKVLKFAYQLPFYFAVNCACMLQEAVFKQEKQLS